MKKIIFVLMFSLGLLSVANAESVCNQYQPEYEPSEISNYMVALSNNKSGSSVKNDRFHKKAAKEWDNLIMRNHIGEIKKGDKETFCIYMTTIGQGYLDTRLTAQEIEQFERFLVESGYYNRSLNALVGPYEKK